MHRPACDYGMYHGDYKPSSHVYRSTSHGTVIHLCTDCYVRWVGLVPRVFEFVRPIGQTL